MSKWITLPAAKAGIFPEDLVNAVAADALAPCITRPSAAIALTMLDRYDLVTQKEAFQLPLPP